MKKMFDETSFIKLVSSSPWLFLMNRFNVSAEFNLYLAV